MKSHRLVALTVSLGLLSLAAAGCGVNVLTSFSRTSATTAVPRLVAQYVAHQTRTAKARLIRRLTAPPQVVIFGGSRAMRFDPAFIRRRTGLTAFNAAVTQARPEDAWALLNLLHARFPKARFRFLWVIHGDEFVPRPIDAAVLLDATLSRHFPSRLVRAQMPQSLAAAEARSKKVQIGIRGRRPLAYAADGFVIRGFFGNATPPCGGHPKAVAINIRKTLRMFTVNPVAPCRRSVRYFIKDLRLMDALSSGRPVIVSAPFDQRIYAATVHRGGGVRNHVLLTLLARLHAVSRFSFLDLSRAAAHGFTANQFYDGIHLTPQGAQRVIDLVMRRFPLAL